VRSEARVVTARQLDAEDTVSVVEPTTIPVFDPESDAPLPPRVMKVATIIAGAIVRQMRAEAAAVQTHEGEPESRTP
jgi:hypothetical protein